MITFRSGGAILCLHSLSTTALPSAGQPNIDFDQFFSLVRTIRRVATIVPLVELLEQHRRGRPTGGTVALTFDDAYASLLAAAELVRAESIPLTVFVTTKMAESGAAYWWDRVDDLFLRVAASRWARFENSLGLPQSYRSGQTAEYGPLRPLRQWILSEHRGRWPAQFEPILASLEEEAGFRTLHRSMTFDELRGFIRVPGVDVAVHTETHPVIPLLTEEESHQEIAGSYRTLLNAVPTVRPILAFPFGLFDERSEELANNAGMVSSLSVVRRTISGFQPHSVLPRFCLTKREKAWKLVLRVTGLGERLFPGRMERHDAFPVLPSPTT